MDIYKIIGFIVTVITIIFAVLPCLIAIMFDYSAETYMDQVKCGLALLAIPVGIILITLAAFITGSYLCGDFDVISKLVSKIGGLIGRD